MAAQQEQAPERSPADGPGAPTGHSGRLLVRMPSTLHAELAEVARREGVSLNALVIGALSGAVGWRSPETARTVQDEDARNVPPATAPPATAASGAAGMPPMPPAAPPPAVAPSRALSVALAVNLVVVLVAAAAAIGLVIAAWPS
jgi:hypothetical protein